MKSASVILGVVFLFFIIVFGTQYGVLAIGSTDQGVNMSGNAFESQYKSSQNVSIAAMEFQSVNPMFIAVGLIIMVLLYMFLKR